MAAINSVTDLAREGDIAIVTLNSPPVNDVVEATPAVMLFVRAPFTYASILPEPRFIATATWYHDFALIAPMSVI